MATKNQTMSPDDMAAELRRVAAILGELGHYIDGNTDRERTVACALHDAARDKVCWLLDHLDAQQSRRLRVVR
jgi:hypothetical protein